MRFRTKTLIIVTATIAAALTLTTGYAVAHGVMGSVEIHDGVRCIKAWYSTGEVMNYDKIKVFSPNLKRPFQIGRTDNNGRFCFYPDVPGEWKVTVDDEMGHLLRMKINVIGPREIQKEIKSKRNTINTLFRAVIGVAIIMILFAGIYVVTRRKGHS